MNRSAQIMQAFALKQSEAGKVTTRNRAQIRGDMIAA